MTVETVSNPPTADDVTRYSANLQANETRTNADATTNVTLPGGGTVPSILKEIANNQAAVLASVQLTGIPYADEPTGRAAVADGALFAYLSGSTNESVVIAQRVNSGSSTVKKAYPTKEYVDSLAASADIAAIHQTLDPIAAHFPAGYTNRSGWPYAIIDSAKRTLHGLYSVGGLVYKFFVNVRIAKTLTVDGTATFNGSTAFTQSLGINSATYNQQPIAYLAYPVGNRSGVIAAILDSARRKLWELRADKTLWIFGKQAVTADMLTGLVIQDRFADSSNYEVFTKADGSSKRQIFAAAKSTGLLKQLSSSGSNNYDPRITADGVNVIYITDRTSGPVRGLLYAPLSGGSEAPVFPVAGTADAVGDSLTVGTGSTGGSTYPAQLSTLITVITVTNFGIGGQKSTQIVMRMGAQPTNLTVSGNAIPAGATPVSVTAINGVALVGIATAQDPDYRLLSTPAGNGALSLAGTMQTTPAIHGTLSATGSGGPPSTSVSYTFTPDTGTPGAACPPGTAFVPDQKALSQDHELWICIGRNNYGDATSIKADITALINMARPLYKRILLFSIINGNYTNEYLSQSSWVAITTLNSWMASTYPQYYVKDSAGRDLRQRLVASYNASLPGDVIANGNDTIPPSLHYMGAGYGGTLSASIGTSDTTITTSIALIANHTIQIDSELMFVTAGGTTSTVTRAYGGTAAAAHSSGTTVNEEDSIHLNNSGYGVWAAIANEFRQAQGMTLS